MILGILSDTHNIDDAIIKRIVAEFKQRGVTIIIHCGDIESQHFNSELYGNLPVVCALTGEQPYDQQFTFAPAQWALTNPDHRIVNLGPFKVYVGHKRAFDFLISTEMEFEKIIGRISTDHDNVRWIFAGHTHHQIYKQSMNCGFINPGAVLEGFDGHEFAIVNCEKKEVVFSRIPLAAGTGAPFTIGIISDTGNISQLDPSFWSSLADEFVERDVSIVLHGGNIQLSDIGRQELSRFQVYFHLLKYQKKPKDIPENWHLVTTDKPIVEIEGYRFYMQYDLGAEFLNKSEAQLFQSVKLLNKEHQHIDFVICGLIHGALFVEGQEAKIIYPGDARNQRKFTTVCLPRNEITFG